MSRFFAVLLALAVSSASGETVESLTEATFEERIKSDIILVKFYAPWCGHCKAMAPAYEEAAKKLAAHDPPIPLAKVDSTVEEALTNKQGVQGYPTLKIFRKGTASDYGGPRDAAGIVNYMLQQIGAATPVTDHVSPLLLAKLCQDQACNDELYPIIDYDSKEKKCVCAAHPCWDDDGKSHACHDDKFSHLTFSYTKGGKLECGCRAEPHYMSKYIAQEKCPGEHCDDGEHAILDYDTEANKCVCKKHPCHDMGGVRHDCSDPKYPILHYREEKVGGVLTPVCECKAKIGVSKKDEL
jgi:protein disulfide-isomerase-like protein